MTAPVTFSRISSLSRLSVCPAAAAQSEGVPEIHGDATALGSAMHEYLEKHAPAPPERHEAIAAELSREWQCDKAALLDLIGKNDFDPSGGVREFAVTLRIPAGDGHPEIHVPGHVDWHQVVDLYHADRAHLVVYDYKTSQHPDHAISIERDAQIHGYALALLDYYRNFPDGEPEFVMVGKYYPVLGADGYETITMHEREINESRAWLTRVVRRAWRQTQLPPEKRSYRPNEVDWSVGCRGCAGLPTCAAKRHEVQRSIAMIGVDPEQAPDVDSNETAVALFEAGKHVSTAEKNRRIVSARIVAWIEEHGGAVEIDDKRVLVVREQYFGRGPIKYPTAIRKQEVPA